MYTLCLWALGTWQLFQIEKRVPTTLSLLGYSERLQGGTLQQLGMRRAGGSGQGSRQELGCIRLRVQLANAVPALCTF